MPLNFPSARLRAYPREAVVAEKLEALVKLGMANTRMKDFYDLWTLSQDFDFDGALLVEAIESTFTRRGTEVPAGIPLALTIEFSRDTQKARQLARQLRHRDARTTLQKYGHVVGDAQRRAVEMLAENIEHHAVIELEPSAEMEPSFA